MAGATSSMGESWTRFCPGVTCRGGRRRASLRPIARVHFLIVLADVHDASRAVGGCCIKQRALLSF